MRTQPRPRADPESAGHRAFQHFWDRPIVRRRCLMSDDLRATRTDRQARAIVAGDAKKRIRIEIGCFILGQILCSRLSLE